MKHPFVAKGDLHGQDGDQGGWAPREQITEALQDLGLLPTVVVVGEGKAHFGAEGQ